MAMYNSESLQSISPEKRFETKLEREMRLVDKRVASL